MESPETKTPTRFTPQEIEERIKQIQADIDALRNSPLSITTIRQAFEWWFVYTKRAAELKDLGEVAQSARRKLQELEHLCAAILCHFCEQRGMDTRSLKYVRGYKGNAITVSGRMQWEVDADLIEMLIKTEEAKAQTPSGGTVPHATNLDPYQQQRDFAKAHLGAKERRIVELVCDNGGICLIKDLAVDPAIAWQKPWDDSYSSAQGRINRKCKKLQQLWAIRRKGNAATIMFLDRN